MGSESPGPHRSDLPPSAHQVMHLRPRDSAGLVFVGAAVALTGLSFYLASQARLAAWLAGQVLLALALLQWFVLLHECGHETLFRTRRLHRPVGHVAAFFAVIPFECWKRVHGLHHKWTGWQDLDPTTTALVPRPLGRGERLLVNVCWKAWIPLFSLLYRAGNFWNVARLWRLFPRPGLRRRLAVNVACHLVVYAAVVAVVGLGEVVRLAGLGLLLSLMLEDPLLLSQHTHVPLNRSDGKAVVPYAAVDQAVFTRSLRFPRWVAAGVLLNLGAHELHHMYPFVPGYDLTRVEFSTENELPWWQWVRAAKRVPGEVLLFQNRTESGLDI
ncbi:MAG: hypothetical protein DMD79_01125 [Candidatus Rokuibacteriota bacterium]|nr:MAG: hypothetical protein DMD79_01125 [Candidatus Rokubacteria bacterium]